MDAQIPPPLLLTDWSATLGVPARWCEHVCGGLTVSSGKQGRGTAHPQKPLAEHGAICFWKCQNENHFRNGKLLLLNPLTFP